MATYVGPSGATSFRSAIALATFVFLLFAAPCLAEEPQITVVGQGEVKAKPTEMIVAAEITGQAEMATDALAKFKDAKRRALATADELKIQNLTIEPGGVTFWEGHNLGQEGQQEEGGESPTPMKSAVRAAERVRWVVKGVDKMQPEEVLEAMAKLSDAIHDLGKTTATSTLTDNEGENVSMFFFRVPDPEPAREQARKLAIEDATARAGKIAAQLGGKLGRAVTVREDRFDLNAGYESYDVHEEQAQHVQRNAMTEVAIRAQMTITFEFTPGPTAGPAAAKPAGN